MVWMKLTNGESTGDLSPLAAETLTPAFDRILASAATQINHSSFCRVSGYVGSLIVRCTNSPLAIAASKTFFRNRMGRKYWFSFFASSALEYVFCRSILFLGIFFVLSFGPSALCNLRVWSSHFSLQPQRQNGRLCVGHHTVDSAHPQLLRAITAATLPHLAH